MHTSQEEEFLQIVLTNPINSALLERLAIQDLPDWYLVAGCLVQTVWNKLSGNPLEYGILDYDVFYCDCEDLSWEAEDRVIKRCAVKFADLGVEVQVRNQARVHLWYEQKYGSPCPPLKSSCESIDSFLNQSSCFGVRQKLDGNHDVYAPFGFADLFDMIMRPNAKRNTPHVYYSKAQRRIKVWPRLKVLPWPEQVSISEQT